MIDTSETRPVPLAVRLMSTSQSCVLLVIQPWVRQPMSTLVVSVILRMTVREAFQNKKIIPSITATTFNQQPFCNASEQRTHSNQTKMKLHCVQRLVIIKLLVVKSPYGWLGHGKEVDPLPPFPCLCPIRIFVFKIQSVKFP